MERTTDEMICAGCGERIAATESLCECCLAEIMGTDNVWTNQPEKVI